MLSDTKMKKSCNFPAGGKLRVHFPFCPRFPESRENSPWMATLTRQHHVALAGSSFVSVPWAAAERGRVGDARRSVNSFTTLRHFHLLVETPKSPQSDHFST